MQGAGIFNRLIEKGHRYVESGYDLDLSYIKPNIIVMSFPSQRRESVSKGDSNDLSRFLDEKYPGHYKIYNLCLENYNTGRFHHRVASYPFDSHDPPPIELIQAFCQDMDEWLNADNENISVVHCRDGLGRTGTMVCSYLLHNGAFDSAKEVLQFFGEARAQDKEGVSVPSQRRYVEYYSYLLKNNLLYSPKTVLLHSIKLIGIPSVLGGSFRLCFTITLQNVKAYTSQVYSHFRKTDTFAELMLPQKFPLCGDVKMEFFHQSFIGHKEKLFTFWFNTFFVSGHLNQEAIFQCSTLNLKEENFPAKRPVSHVLSEKIGKAQTLVKQFGANLFVDSRIRSRSLGNLTELNKVSSLNKELSKSSDIFAGLKNASEQNVCKDMQMTKRKLKRALKSAGKKAGVDITTGCTRLIRKPLISNPVLLEYHRNALLPIPVNDVESDDEGSSPIGSPQEFITHEQNTLVLLHSELDHTSKDKKRYPSGFQVHVILSTLQHSISSDDMTIVCPNQVDDHIFDSDEDIQ